MKFLKKYIEADDSLKIANEQLASSEFATLLNVEKLNAEKKELMLRTKEKELSNKTTLIFSLIHPVGHPLPVLISGKPSEPEAESIGK